MYSYLSHSINPTTQLGGVAYWHKLVGREEAICSAKIGQGMCDLSVSGSPADLRRLAAACIEAAEKGEALEAERNAEEAA